MREEDIVSNQQGLPKFEVAKCLSFPGITWEWPPGQAVSVRVLSPVIFELVGPVLTPNS